MTVQLLKGHKSTIQVGGSGWKLEALFTGYKEEKHHFSLSKNNSEVSENMQTNTIGPALFQTLECNELLSLYNPFPNTFQYTDSLILMTTIWKGMD